MGYSCPVASNPEFWTSPTSVFRGMHISAIEAFRNAALGKVVPAFRDIAREAGSATDKKYPGAMARDDDSLAELAIDHYAECYEMLSGVRQGVLNLLAVGLYHLFEQQQLLLLQTLTKDENESPTTTRVEECLAECLAECGIESQKFACADKLSELKVAANAIKHGKGRASGKLASLRPDLFQNPAFSESRYGEDHDYAKSVAVDSFFAPLTGDLYVSESDLSEWCNATKAYWEELAVAGDVQRTRLLSGNRQP